MSIIAGEKGKKLRLNADYDLTNATQVNLIIDGPPPEAKKTVQTVVGTVDVNEDGITLLANHYVEYEIGSADGTTEFPVKGYYVLKLNATFPGSKNFKSEDKTILVLE